ncbi:MAG: hypothetical protein Q7V88_19295 [Actinomycetota bacterium]|nr:hypothetical protein [Actinomycetota bacterium]
MPQPETPASDPSAPTVERHPFVSSSLGMIQFPVGTVESRDVGDHIMGVTVIGWLSRFPVAEWGQQWATTGALEVRFRSHLTAGLQLDALVQRGADTISMTVAGPDGHVYATATATRVAAPMSAPVAAPAPAGQTPATHAALSGLGLAAMPFRFDAARDLVFTRSLVDGSFWVQHGWAHPAWLASSANAIIMRSVEFPTRDQWKHAGIELALHAPVADGDEVVVQGSVGGLFDGRSNRFAVATLVATVGDRPVATMRKTFAYAPVE